MKISCILCGSKHTRFHLQKFGHSLYECRECGLIFLSPLPSEEVLSSLYGEGYFTGDKEVRGYGDYEGDLHNLRRNFSQRLSFIKRSVSKGNLLDVGCATGVFISEAQKAGFNAYGIDVSSFAVKRALKRMPGKVFISDLLHFKSPCRFSVITMWDVLEHLSKPRETVRRAYELLDDNGVLVIGTGNVKSHWVRLVRERWHGYNPPQHTLYFSPNSLQHLLESEGFRILYRRSEGKWLSLRYISHIARGLYQNRFANIFYTAFNKTPIGAFSVYVNLFDSLFVVAQKIKGSSGNKVIPNH